MKTINPEHIQAVIKLINQSPYFKLLAMSVEQLGAGYCRVEVDIEHRHRNPFGGIHGGVYSSLIDTAAFWALYCDIAEDAGFTSLDVNVTMLAPVRAGHLIVEGKSIRVGKTVCIGEAAVMDQNRKCLAHGVSKILVTTGVQTIAQAVRSLGYEDLPPKYID